MSGPRAARHAPSRHAAIGPGRQIRPQLIRAAVLPTLAAGLSGTAAVIFTLQLGGGAGERDARLWPVLTGCALLVFGALAAALLGAQRAAKAVRDRCEALRRSSVRGRQELRTAAERLERGETPPRPVRGAGPTGPGLGVDAAGIDEFWLLSQELRGAREQAHAALVRLAGPAAPSDSERKVEVFVNLARRLQSLVHREISLLDDLEDTVEDPELLRELFHVDHLATRIRRHAENLAVLGGAASRRQWTRPIDLSEVLRSSVAEVEQYTRVKVVPPAGGSVRGHAVADVVHLLAELVENATVFSAPDTDVVVRAERVTAGIAVEVEDRGLGMPAEEQHRMNALLGDPDQISVRHLLADGRIGLYVVSALARRHGIAVELKSNIYGGVLAVLVLPQELLGAAAAAPETAPPPRLEPARLPTPSWPSPHPDPTAPPAGRPAPSRVTAGGRAAAAAAAPGQGLGPVSRLGYGSAPTPSPGPGPGPDPVPGVGLVPGLGSGPVPGVGPVPGSGPVPGAGLVPGQAPSPGPAPEAGSPSGSAAVSMPGRGPVPGAGPVAGSPSGSAPVFGGGPVSEPGPLVGPASECEPEPGSSSGSASACGGGPVSERGPVAAPASEFEPEPGSRAVPGPGSVLGAEPTPGPGSVPGPGSTRGPGSVPGSGSTPRPGAVPGPGSVLGAEPTPDPRSVPGLGAVSGSGPVPGSGIGAGSAAGGGVREGGASLPSPRSEASADPAGSRALGAAAAPRPTRSGAAGAEASAALPPLPVRRVGGTTPVPGAAGADLAEPVLGSRSGAALPPAPAPGTLIRTGPEAAAGPGGGSRPVLSAGRAAGERPELPRRRAQQHLAPQLREAPAPRRPADDAEQPVHDPGLMAAFQRGFGLAQSTPTPTPTPHLGKERTP
ncbi:ATP-binding protein [Streptomyces sp. NPDC091371]|uniref:sensor histidine kinase n=1 Tax=Streptomyces sp. NPDC091371 TaxID=3155303 RepID=UPI003432E1C3